MPNIFLTLLQVPIITPKVLPPDSVHQVARDIVAQLQTNPNEFWDNLLHTAINFGMKVLAAIIIYLVGIWIIRWVKKLLKRVFERRQTEQTLASFVTSFVSIGLTVVLIIVTVSTLGVDTTSLAALLAAGGVAIGMALSGTVQNFAGGIMLLTFKPFRAGDFIEAEGFAGRVVEVNITTTKLLTPDNRVVIMPNGALSNGNINNITGRPFRRVEWLVSVSYGVDAAECKKTIVALLNEEPRVLKEDTNMKKLYKELNVTAYQLSTVGYKMDAIPAPMAALKSLNANDITFVVRCWVRSDDYWDVFFAMQERFYTELPKHGFTFAYPHVELVTSGSEPNVKTENLKSENSPSE